MTVPLGSPPVVRSVGFRCRIELDEIAGRWLSEAARDVGESEPEYLRKLAALLIREHVHEVCTDEYEEQLRAMHARTLAQIAELELRTTSPPSSGSRP